MSLIAGYSLLITASIAHATLVPCGIGLGAGDQGPVKECTVCDFFVLINNILKFLVESVALPVGIIVLIYGGIMMVTSVGSEDKIKKGKNAIWQAVWGMLITFGAWLIVDTIIKELAAPGNWLFGPWNALPSGC